MRKSETPKGVSQTVFHVAKLKGKARGASSLFGLTVDRRPTLGEGNRCAPVVPHRRRTEFIPHSFEGRPSNFSLWVEEKQRG